MTVRREQFQLQIDRLSDTFGDKHFPEQRVLMIWEVVEGLDYGSVIALTDGFIRASKFAPLPSDFSEAAKDFKRSSRRYALGEIQPQEIARCLDCGDSGFVRLTRKDGAAAWAKWATGSAPCHCGRGRELLFKAANRAKGPLDLGPQFSQAWESSYAVVPAYEVPA